MHNDEVTISFDASVTLLVDREVFNRSIDQYQEMDETLTHEQAVDEYLMDLAADFEGVDLFSVEGDAFLAFVDNGQVL